MSATTPYEQGLLRDAQRCLRAQVAEIPGPDHEVRLDVLEALATLVGGFSLETFWSLRPERHHLAVDDALTMAEILHKELLSVSEIHPSLALASLAQRDMDFMDRRTSGAYYTDFRLATHVARGVAPRLTSTSKIVDPSSGTGILLAAVVLATAERNSRMAMDLLANGVFASDLSLEALRGVVLTLASLTDDLGVIKSIQQHVVQMDALTGGLAAWTDFAPKGFDCVVGNPPWEKLKVSRHEFLVRRGSIRHYGDEYGAVFDDGAFDQERMSIRDYVDLLKRRFPLQREGEPDLYKLFLELSLELLRPGGELSLVLPGGLIRSQGAQKLRTHLLTRCTNVEMTIFDNKDRFFEIDTRFKFMILTATAEAVGTRSIELRHSKASGDGTVRTATATINVQRLVRLRPDLTVPEVRSADEWALFERLHQRSIRMEDSSFPWSSRIVREIDMTRDRGLFSRERVPGSLPLIEGRMVAQFRLGAKSYVGGTGRRADWRWNVLGKTELRPQFWIRESELSDELRERVARPRVGFCDITGQTNERSLLATWIPPGAVCGNKVPTITLSSRDGGDSGDYVWVVLSNSFVFDWLVRRIITTTVNFFLLRSLPIPVAALSSPLRARLEQVGRSIDFLARNGGDPWALAEARAAADVVALVAYGVSPRDLDLILRDFKLLDRGQPAIAGERSSTVTKDLLMLRAIQELGGSKKDAQRLTNRLAQAREVGAVPYVPSQYARSVK